MNVRPIITSGESDVGEADGWLGTPRWGPQAFLGDLELRLGLPGGEVDQPVRVQRYAARLARLAPSGPFYAAPFAVDPSGVAAELLRWRDELVLGGWRGQDVVGAARISALAAVEALGDPGELGGYADRVRVVQDELSGFPVRLYDALTLVEDVSCWPTRWRRIFEALAARGTVLRREEPSFVLAPAATDLGRIQRALGGDLPGDKIGLSGDGSLVVLRGDTPVDLAAAAAALLATGAESDVAVIRGIDTSSLDAALRAHHLPSMGVSSPSGFRPPLQILSLALELAFEPRNPQRMVELLTLPDGPFAGIVGRRLAKAFCDAPGIGAPQWREAKEWLAERLASWTRERGLAEGKSPDEAEALAVKRVRDVEERIGTWLEGPLYGATGAPPAALAEVAERVAAWCQKRFGVTDSPAWGAAARQARAFIAALAADPRDALDAIAVRQLVEEATGEVAIAIETERAGRIDHVPAGALSRARNCLLWWGFVSTEAAPRRPPWRAAEIARLEAAGVHLVSPRNILAARAAAWRRGLMAARERLVLAIPSFVLGEPSASHPLWDEIIARIDRPSLARITRTTAQLLRGEPLPAAAPLPVEILPPLALPAPRPVWRVRPELISLERRYSATSLEALLGCPLRWSLDELAGIEARDHMALPANVLLAGSLGHRLVEVLHEEGAFAGSIDVLYKAAEAAFERLLHDEGTPLLVEGMSFELAQVRASLLESVTALRDVLEQAGLSLVAVEENVAGPMGGRELRGRVDLLVARDDQRAVLDLKWGRKRYDDKLARGEALQLAIYAGLLRGEDRDAAFPEAAYFSLKGAKLLALRHGLFGDHGRFGAPLEDTWNGAERLAEAVEKSLADGTIFVGGLAEAPPLLDALQLEADGLLTLKKDDVCDYCNYGAICGKRWETVE